MAAYVVIAEFTVPAVHRAEFLTLCQFDSERSVGDEPGCRRFDVSTAVDAPEHVVLYEVYDDRAAFDTHKTMPHFTVFSEGLKRLQVTTVQVRFFDRQYA
jgi:autoinducer 2-degrading protein